MDGGILNGTPNSVTIDNMIDFQSIIDKTFPIIAILAIIIFVSYVFIGVINKLRLRLEKNDRLKKYKTMLDTKR
jgi:hypothetical protein